MQLTRFLFIGLILFSLTACGGVSEVRKQFGLKKDAPDEFAVLRRAPLEVPPPEDIYLPEPKPGAARPQEKSADQLAKVTLFGPVTAPKEAPQSGRTLTSGESRFLDLAGTAEADPSARDVIDQETAALHDRNKPVAERLLNIGGNAAQPSATVVDAKAEAERLKQNMASGKPVTEGETPSIEE